MQRASFVPGGSSRCKDGYQLYVELFDAGTERGDSSHAIPAHTLQNTYNIEDQKTGYLRVFAGFQQTFPLDVSPGAPVPHADVLGELLDGKDLKNYTETDSISVFDYLFGISPNITELDNADVSDNLDICLLTPENIKKVVERAQIKFEKTRFRNETIKGSRRYYNYIYYYNREYITKAMNWMKQSIYGTRRRLEVTRPFRKKFHNNINYNMGVLYGILSEIMLKQESMYSQMKRIHFHFPFLWFVQSYQRILSFNVDISYIVQRMFVFQKKWNVLIGRKEKGDSAEDEEVEGPIENIDNQTMSIPELDQELNTWGDQDKNSGNGPNEQWGNENPGQKYGPGQYGEPGEGPHKHGGPGNQGAPGDYAGPDYGNPRWDQNPDDDESPSGGPDFFGGPPGGPDGPDPFGGPPHGRNG